MFNKIIMILYNSSILIPFILAIGILNLFQGRIVMGVSCVCFSLILSGFQIVLKWYSLNRLAVKRINITNITRDNDSWIFAIYVSYFIPFLETFIGNSLSFSFSLSTLGGILLLLLSHKSVENPILRILGYKIYNIETEHGVDYILWSKKYIRNKKTVTHVVRFSEIILLEVS